MITSNAIFVATNANIFVIFKRERWDLFGVPCSKPKSTFNVQDITMKRIRLAIIGCGGFVRWLHVPAIKKCRRLVNLVALADTAAANAESLAAEHYPGRKLPIYTDHARMLKDIAPDAVLVSTPHTLHFRHCYDSLSAGAHVLVEKPMFTNSDDARKLVRRAKAKKLSLQIAIQGLYTDTFAYARQLIEDGTVGQLELATGMLAQGWLKGGRGSWRQNPKLSGGGQLYDSTAHVISAILFLVNSPVREVVCWADMKGTRVDINAVALIRFANGCMATITSGGNCPTWYSHMTLQGPNAFMEISPHGGDFRIASRNLKKEITKVPRGWNIPTVSVVRNFANSILGKDTPRCGGKLGVALADLMDGLYESVRKGRPVKVSSKRKK